jgi:uncharacterized protein YbjT (DUF2867 family)
LIFGVTGNIGGAVARELLKRGWHVRAVTRTPGSEKAEDLSGLGVEVVQGDMDNRASLEVVFDGMPWVLSVQNWVTSGVDGEIRQGKLVADVARSVGVEHLVYASAGTGERGSGIPHFENKIVVEDYMRQLELPCTIVRPTPFMELLSEKQFYPAMGSWGVEPRVVGWETPLPWVAVHDLGLAIANVFEEPKTWIGRDISLCSDVKTFRESQAIFVAIDGKKPLRIPYPLWLFSKMAGDEFVDMWHWMVGFVLNQGPEGLRNMVEASREVSPQLLDMESWLKMKRNGVNS